MKDHFAMCNHARALGKVYSHSCRKQNIENNYVVVQGNRSILQKSSGDLVFENEVSQIFTLSGCPPLVTCC